MNHRNRQSISCAAILALAQIVSSGSAQAQATLDLCGCENLPSLGAFDSADASSYAAYATRSFGTIEIAVPESGVLVLDSFKAESIPGVSGSVTVAFARNSANTPVTILVKGDFELGFSDTLQLSGQNGASGSSGGRGGLGGPGGFRGGNGAFQAVTLESDGSTGGGPGGGRGGVTGQPAEGGTYFGNDELLPLVGGAGGGGGDSTSTLATCSGGGGGGGGGALLLAANGQVTLNGSIRAQGSSGGSTGNGSCASDGAGGSGGAVRLLAGSFSGVGSILANPLASTGSPGRIRIEVAGSNTFPKNSLGSTNPLAVQTPLVGPISLPRPPTVAITRVDGQDTPSPPQGWQGFVDVFVNQPGSIDFDVRTENVPGGTTIALAAKPQSGDGVVEATATLDTCDPVSGVCTTTAPLSLAPGPYVVEARATFEVP